MKKEIGCGLAAILCLVLTALLGCSEPGKIEQEPVAAPTKLNPKITITTESPSDSRKATPSELVRTEQGPGDATCQTDSDCGLIPEPAEECIPCLNSSGQRAVNKQAGRSIMGPLKDKCLPVIEQLQKQGQQGGGQGGQGGQGQGPQRSNDQSCRFNGAKCVEGTCQLANLSRKELQAVMPQGARGQGGPQGGQPSGGFDGQRGGQPNGGFDDQRGGQPSGGFDGQQGGQPSGGQFGGQQGGQPNGFGGQRGGGFGGQFGGQQGGYGRYDRQKPGYGYGRQQPGYGDQDSYQENSDRSRFSLPQGYGQRNNYPGANPGFSSRNPDFGAGLNPGYGNGANSRLGSGLNPGFDSGANPRWGADWNQGNGANPRFGADWNGANPRFGSSLNPGYRSGATPGFGSDWNKGGYGAGADPRFGSDLNHEYRPQVTPGSSSRLGG